MTEELKIQVELITSESSRQPSGGNIFSINETVTKLLFPSYIRSIDVRIYNVGNSNSNLKTVKFVLTI
jgi:hypothetical protein